MAKLVKFPLALADGTKARTIEELREHADIASIAQHFENGKLQRWLAANYLDDLLAKADSARKGLKQNFAKVKVAAVKEVCEGLGLTRITEDEIAEYVGREANETNDENFSDGLVEIEDDANLKTELKTATRSNNINLDDWKIAETDAEKEGQTVVNIQNNSTGMLISLGVQKESKSVDKLLVLLRLAEKMTAVLKTESSAYSEIAKIQNSKQGDTVHFGKYDWIVANIENDKFLLICKTVVDTEFHLRGGRGGDRLDNVSVWLNQVFLSETFSEYEKEFLLNKDYCKVFIPNEKEARYLSKEDRSKGVNWLLRNAWVYSDGDVFYGPGDCDCGIVPAVIVGLK